MATKKSSIKTFHTKKEVKKELANKIETALPEIKETLGKKKFNKRLKKATRLLTEGLHLNGTDKKNKSNQKKPQNKKAVVKTEMDNGQVDTEQKDALAGL